MSRRRQEGAEGWLSRNSKIQKVQHEAFGRLVVSVVVLHLRGTTALGDKMLRSKSCTGIIRHWGHKAASTAQVLGQRLSARHQHSLLALLLDGQRQLSDQTVELES